MTTLDDSAKTHLGADARLLLSAYGQGVFPMADADSGDVEWYRPQYRGIVPLETFHVSRRLAQTVRAGRFDVCVNRAFRTVMEACAEEKPSRASTWISDEIIELYCQLGGV